MRRTLPLPLLLVMALALAPASAQARKRAVILPFSGPKAKSVHKAIVKAFEGQGRIEVLSESSLVSAARRLGYKRRDLSDEGTLALAATEIRADAVVRGSTSRKRRTSYLHLKVHDGGTGKVLGSHRIKLRRGRADRATARRVVSVAIPTILKGSWKKRGSTRPTRYGRRPPQEPPPRERPPHGEAGLEPLAELEPLDEAGLEPLDESGGRSGTDLEALVPGDPYAEVSVSGPGRPLAEAWAVTLGVMGLRRAYRLEGNSDGGESLPIKYDSGYFAAAWAWGEVFPFALTGEGGGLSALGLEGSLELGSLESDLKIADDTGGPREVQGVETTQRLWSAGLVYRLFPWATSNGPLALRVLAGFSSATFALAEGPHLSQYYKRNDYSALRLGVDLRLPVAYSDGWRYVLLARGAGLVTWADLNEQEAYPTTSGLGWEAMGGLDIDIGGGWMLAADYRVYSFPVEYDAQGDDKPALKSDDLYHGFVLQMGYRD